MLQQHSERALHRAGPAGIHQYHGPAIQQALLAKIALRLPECFLGAPLGKSGESPVMLHPQAESVHFLPGQRAFSFLWGNPRQIGPMGCFFPGKPKPSQGPQQGNSRRRLEELFPAFLSGQVKTGRPPGHPGSVEIAAFQLQAQGPADFLAEHPHPIAVPGKEVQPFPAPGGGGIHNPTAKSVQGRCGILGRHLQKGVGPRGLHPGVVTHRLQPFPQLVL